jgi:hypothetical protein
VARKGTFGFGLTPPITDLSAYQIGTRPAAPPAQLPQPPPTQDWYQAAPPPERPTVAPEVGTMPEPVIPRVVSPYVQLRSEYEGIYQRALDTGHTPTVSDVTATAFKYQSSTMQAELAAIRARAIANGHTPTDADVMNTYLRNLARAAG